jgi:hypothetical protein
MQINLICIVTYIKIIIGLKIISLRQSTSILAMKVTIFEKTQNGEEQVLPVSVIALYYNFKFCQEGEM